MPAVSRSVARRCGGPTRRFLKRGFWISSPTWWRGVYTHDVVTFVHGTSGALTYEISVAYASLIPANAAT